MSEARRLAFMLVVALVACSGASDNESVPEDVIATVSAIANAAKSGNIETIEPLLSPQFESPYEDLFATLNEDEGVRRRLLITLAGEPGMRRSPFGNGAVQELWVYPHMALEPPDTWSESQIETALDSGLMTQDELELSLETGAYRAFSAGFDPTGTWVFFVTERVSPTPHP